MESGIVMTPVFLVRLALGTWQDPFLVIVILFVGQFRDRGAPYFMTSRVIKSLMTKLCKMCSTNVKRISLSPPKAQ